MPPLLLPPPLADGDLLGVIAPASPPPKPEEIDANLARLEAHGFRVRAGKNLRRRGDYLAGTDEERASDFNAFVADPEIKGIVALRGGYGSCRILPLLDYAAFRAHPKLFIGYSDITAMHIALLQHSGVVTFHGPNGSEAFLPENAVAYHQALTTPVGPGLIISRGKTRGLRTLVPGRAAGRLIGGNMTCLLRLLGTPYAPDFEGALLFLEDIGEKAYRVDGLFTQLHLSGAIKKIRGLILGRFDHRDDGENNRIALCLEREAERAGLPCVSNAPIGHFPGQTVIPHGIFAELDAGAGTLTGV
jgi:muramoyltetrapeptide carboxypeptidase